MTRRLRIDALPEDHPYQDEGCAYVAPSCLSCPMVACVYEGSLGVRPYMDNQRLGPRNARIREQRGVSASLIALGEGVSTRTVWRVLAV